jgi:hypothetical protein
MTVAGNVSEDVSGLDGGLPGRVVPLVGAALCALVLAVYLTTMGRTVPFWDAGEFIATSKILGIPHPPGTPLYVLLGRLACLVPFGSIAERVNGLSAVASTIAVLFTYLATIKLVHAMWRGEEEAPAWLPLVAGLVAALTLAFSETFWINAIEAEVYGLSSMVMAISIWAVLAWRELPHREQQVGWLLVIFYILSLSIGVHLGTYLVLPGLAVLVTLEWLGQGPYRRPFVWTLVAVMVVLPLLAMLVATHGAAAGLEPLVRFLIRWVPVLGALAVAALIMVRRPRLAVMLLALFVLGVSVHLYLLIRAGVDPPPSINEADPSNWQALWNVLTRKQYPPSDLFDRRGPLLFQFDHMYLRYLLMQFDLRHVPMSWAAAIVLGVFGALSQLIWRRRDAAMMFTHFWVMCVLLVIYLNLAGEQDPTTGEWVRGEVRERDYFFVPSFQIFTMWIGIGTATIGLELWRLLTSRFDRRLAGIALAMLGLVCAATLGAGLKGRYHAIDRTDNFVARDYGYNIINFLEPNALLFTNGDNDTFPLWYLQEVEEIRRDVRVICLSLLNTDWYIRQCRDIEPRVPITFDDELIENMQVAFDPTTSGLFVVDRRLRGRAAIIGPGTIKDVAVRDIIEANDFERPVYFAVTVPDRVGYDEQLSFEGMVFRVFPEPPAQPINFEKTYENAFHNFRYRGLLREDFTRDPRVVVDETGEYLIQNYVNMFAQLAYELNARGRYEEAYKMVVASRAIKPGFLQLDVLEAMLLGNMGRFDEADRVFDSLIQGGEAALDAYYRRALMRLAAKQYGPAAEAMREAVRMAGGEFIEPTLWLARIEWDRGRPSEARKLLADWIAVHPDDTRARRILERLSQNDDSLLPRSP